MRRQASGFGSWRKVTERWGRAHFIFFSEHLKSRFLQKSPTKCFFCLVWFLVVFFFFLMSRTSTSRPQDSVDNTCLPFKSVAEYPRNLYQCSNYVACINFTLLRLFLLFGLALFMTWFIHSLFSLFTKYLLGNKKKIGSQKNRVCILITSSTMPGRE